MKFTINVNTINETLHKPKADSTIIVELLKKINVPGNVAAEFFSNYTPEYILRKYMVTEYHKHRLRSPMAYFINDIKNDYSESDDFHRWMKVRKEEIYKSDVPIELKKLIGRI